MIGFIGLGIMGKPMAVNLIKAGYDVIVYNRNAEKAKDIEKLGGVQANSIVELAERSKLIITMLPDSPEAKEVILGKDGIITTKNFPDVIIDMSSISPLISVEIYKEVKKRGIEMLDAPVSGGEPKAIDGTLAVMVGGKEEIFNRYKDIFSPMANSVTYCGDIGSGNIVKLSNQIIVAINIAALCEAYILASKANVSPKTVLQAIRGGLAGSSVLEAKSENMFNHNFNPGFRIDLHIKDMKNVMSMAAAHDLDLSLTSKTLDMLLKLSEKGLGDLDHSGLLKFYEEVNNWVI